MKIAYINFTFPPLLFLAIHLVLSGCSVMVGNIKPIDRKSETYGIMDLSQINPNWIRLNTENNTELNAAPDSLPTDISDVAYQDQKTASIISLNSACRTTHKPEENDLKAMTNVLFLGISDLTIRTQSPTVLQDLPALETVVEGKLNDESMILKTLVFRRGNCIYDLVYMARPTSFEKNEPDFAHFIASLRLK